MITPLVLAILFILLLSWLICFSYTFKKKLTNMIGMVVSMTLGMMVGLSIGTLLAVLFAGSLFQMTILSMIIGSVIGVIAGFPFSQAAVLDGLMSGMMGGMMGAMLGMMIDPQSHELLLNIIGVWTAGVFFLVYLLQISEVTKICELQKKSLLLHPFPYFIVACLFIYGVHHVTFESSSQEPGRSAHRHHTETIIYASDYQFTPNEIKVTVGEEITLTLINDGAAEHDFDIIGTSYHLHAAPGSTDSISAIFDKAGVYEVICTLPGHQEAGMVAKLIVSEF